MTQDEKKRWYERKICKGRKEGKKKERLRKANSKSGKWLSVMESSKEIFKCFRRRGHVCVPTRSYESWFRIGVDMRLHLRLQTDWPRKCMADEGRGHFCKRTTRSESIIPLRGNTQRTFRCELRSIAPTASPVN